MYDIHCEIVSKHIKTRADFVRYLIFVNNYDTAKRLIAQYSNKFIKDTYLAEQRRNSYRVKQTGKNLFYAL